jgi:hypothetical protein
MTISDSTTYRPKGGSALSRIQRSLQIRQELLAGTLPQ